MRIKQVLLTKQKFNFTVCKRSVRRIAARRCAADESKLRQRQVSRFKVAVFCIYQSAKDCEKYSRGILENYICSCVTGVTSGS